MASQFAQAVQCLVAERDRVFVERVAADYGLPLEELKAKYLECAEAAIKIPRPYKKREPKSVTVVSEGAKPAKEPKAKAAKQCCTAQTSKKEPCKFSALKGEVFCKRHLKASLGEAPAPAKKAPAEAKKAKATAPTHTHPLDVAGTACDLCESHGNPMTEKEPAFEVCAPHTGPVKQPTVAERLAALLKESDAESESDGEVELSVEEEYEDDDE